MDTKPLQNVWKIAEPTATTMDLTGIVRRIHSTSGERKKADGIRDGPASLGDDQRRSGSGNRTVQDRCRSIWTTARVSSISHRPRSRVGRAMHSSQRDIRTLTPNQPRRRHQTERGAGFPLPRWSVPQHRRGLGLTTRPARSFLAEGMK